MSEVIPFGRGEVLCMSDGSVVIVVEDEKDSIVTFRYVDATYLQAAYQGDAAEMREIIIDGQSFFNSTRGIEVAVETAMAIEVAQSELTDGGDTTLYAMIATFRLFLESILGWLPESADYPATYEMMLDWLELAVPRIDDFEPPNSVFDELLDEGE